MDFALSDRQQELARSYRDIGLHESHRPSARSKPDDRRLLLLAPNFETLIVFRALQGAASGPLTALSQALLVAVFPSARRYVALAVWQTTTFVAPVLGRIAGGWITDNVSWPWIFYINVPTGIAVLFILTRGLAGRDNATRKLPVDAVGLLLLALSFGSLQLMLDRGQNLDWVQRNADSRAGGSMRRELRCAGDMGADRCASVVDLWLFTDRNFLAGTVAVTVGFGVYYAALVLVPLWLQTEQGYTATWAGVATAPLGIAGIILAPLIGRVQHRVDPRWFATTALMGWGAASFWRMHFNTEVPIEDIGWNSLLMGAATAFFITPLVSLSIAELPRERLPAASGLQNSLRRIGTSVTTSLAPTFLERRARVHGNWLVDGITPLDPAFSDWFDSLRRAGMSSDGALQSIARSVDVQAYMLALNDFSAACTVLFAATLTVVWITKYRRVR